MRVHRQVGAAATGTHASVRVLVPERQCLYREHRGAGYPPHKSEHLYKKVSEYQNMTDLSLSQFRRAIRSGEPDDLEMMWLELLEEAPVPLKLARRVLNRMVKEEMCEQAGEFAEMLEAELMERGHYEAAAELILDHAGFAPDDRVCRQRYAECMEAIHRERHSRFSDCMREAGVREGQPLEEAAEHLDRLLYFAPGDAVRHRSWGLGTVQDVRPGDESIIVDFPDRPGHRFSLRLAHRALTKLDSGGLEARVARNPEAVKREAWEEPTELVKSLLGEHGGVMKLGDVRQKLTKRIIDPDDWSSWWQKARPKLVGDPWVEVPGGGSSVLRLRDEAVDPVRSALHEAGSEDDPVQCVNLARRLYRRIPDPAQYEESVLVFRDTLRRWADKWADERPGAAFCALFLASEGEDVDMEPPQSVSSALRWMKDMRISAQVEGFLGWLKEHRPELEEELLPSMLVKAPDGARNVARKRMSSEAPGALRNALRKIAQRAEQNVEAFLWLCSEVVRGRLSPPGDHNCATLYSRLLEVASGLNPDGELGSPARDMLLDERFITRALQEVNQEQIDRMRYLAGRLRGPSDAVLSAVRHHLRMERPDIVEAEKQQRRDENAILTTAAGLKKRKEELDELVNERLPQVRQEMGEAAEFGDLSENAEYEAAREEHLRLGRRAQSMEEEIERAKVPSPGEIGTDEVGFGTRVHTIRQNEEGEEEEVVYDILGPWDSDPDGGVISYQAPVARALRGATPGDERTAEVGHNSLHFRVTKIELSPMLDAEG